MRSKLTTHSAKQHAIDQGGKITHEYSLIKGFAYVPGQLNDNVHELTCIPNGSVTFDKDAVTTLESNEHVQAVELDKEVKIN